MKISKNLFFIIFLAFFFSCEKQSVEIPEKEKYVQYFKANIASQSLEIKNSIDENRNIFRGQLTGIGYADGTQKEMYTVNVVVPKILLNTSIDTKFQFQIFDIKKEEFRFSGSEHYKKDFASYVYLVTDLGMPNSKLYTTNETKPSFKITITRYEKEKNSALPFVGGTLNGVLYNVKDLKDSILIKDGTFDVRF